MKLVVQRVKEANVKVDGKIVGEIDKGFLVLVRNYPNRYRKRSGLFS